MSNMPIETVQAVQWALQQIGTDGEPVTPEKPHQLVDKVREWFNSNGISYGDFSFDDLVKYLPH